MYLVFAQAFLLLLSLAAPVLGCRMLGLIAIPGESLSANYENELWHPYMMDELEAFRLQGGSGGWPFNNRDGWAMTSYSDFQDLLVAQTIRSDVEAYSDAEYYAHAASLLTAEQVPVLLGHLRQTSSGAGDIDNPHPFIFDAGNGVTYSFAHNGDVGKEELRTLIGDDWLYQHPPQTYGGGPWDGSGWDEVVDSELFFFWIVRNIQEMGDIFLGIQHAMIILEAQQPFMLKNFLFSDGRDLYGYRRSPMSDIFYFDASAEADIPRYLPESNHSAIMSTPPLSGDASLLPWIELPDRGMVIFRADGSTEVHETFLTAHLPGHPVQPRDSRIMTAYPNPFNQGTLIPLHAPKTGAYTLTIHDLSGRRVFQERVILERGHTHHFRWAGQDLNRCDLPSGSYVYGISGEGESQGSGKLLLVR